MAESIRPLWSFVKINLNIQWSLFTENKHNMLTGIYYYKNYKMTNSHLYHIYKWYTK